MAKRSKGETSSLPAKNKGGRPRTPRTTEEAKERADRDRARVMERQRADLRTLAKRLDEVGKLPNCGATGTQSPAQAVASHARALQTLHQMEAETYEFGQTGSRSKAVFVMPVPVDMAKWAELAAGHIDPAQVQQQEPTGPRRYIEAEVQGEAPAGFREAAESEGDPDQGGDE